MQKSLGRRTISCFVIILLFLLAVPISVSAAYYEISYSGGTSTVARHHDTFGEALADIHTATESGNVRYTLLLHTEITTVSENVSFSKPITIKSATANNQNLLTFRPGVTVEARANVTFDQLYLGGAGATFYANGFDILFDTGVKKAPNNSHSFSTVYGGGQEEVDTAAASHLLLRGGVFDRVYGGGNKGTILGDTHVVMTDTAEASFVFGGGNSGAVQGSTYVSVTGGAAVSTLVLGGGLGQFGDDQAGMVGGNTQVIVGGAGIDLLRLYGGGYYGIVHGDTEVTLTDQAKVTTEFYGGSYLKSTGSTRVLVDNGAKTSCAVYGGGAAENSTVNNTHVTIADCAEVASVYGGGKGSVIEGNTLVEVIDRAKVDADAYGGDMGAAHGGGIVKGHAKVVVREATVMGNVYGGGVADEIQGSASVFIDGAAIEGSVYGGGRDHAASIAQDSQVTLTGADSSVYAVYADGQWGSVQGLSTILYGGGTVSRKITSGNNHGGVIGFYLGDEEARGIFEPTVFNDSNLFPLGWFDVTTLAGQPYTGIPTQQNVKVTFTPSPYLATGLSLEYGATRDHMQTAKGLSATFSRNMQGTQYFLVTATVQDTSTSYDGETIEIPWRLYVHIAKPTPPQRQPIIHVEGVEFPYTVHSDKVVTIAPSSDSMQEALVNGGGHATVDLRTIEEIAEEVYFVFSPTWLDNSGDSLEIVLSNGNVLQINDGMDPQGQLDPTGADIRIRFSSAGFMIHQGNKPRTINSYARPILVGLSPDLSSLEMQNPDYTTDAITLSTDRGGLDAPHTIARSYYRNGLIYAKVYNAGSFYVQYRDAAYVDTKQHWAEKAIGYTSSRGVTEGIGNDQFAPESTVTRAQFATMLMRSMNVQVKGAPYFQDSETIPAWAQDAVAAAQAFGIVEGDENGDFCPDREVTRQDMFVMSYRALQQFQMLSPHPPVHTVTFADQEQISDYAKGAIGAMASVKLVNGNRGRVFPLEESTRAEAAQFLYNILKYDTLRS